VGTAWYNDETAGLLLVFGIYVGDVPPLLESCPEFESAVAVAPLVEDVALSSDSVLDVSSHAVVPIAFKMAARSSRRPKKVRLVQLGQWVRS
jgi:hypothetical protein